MPCPSCGSENDAAAESCFQCGKLLVLTLTQGALLQGRYSIEKILGRGGMGVVYRARDNTLDEGVAIKTLRREAAATPALRKRFLSEIKLARRIRHPYVCAIHEYGEHDGVPFIVMELVEGRDLRDVFRGPTPPSLRETLTISQQIAEGLAAIHGAGIVHRDLKPANVMVAGDGVARLMDFGIAKQLDSEMTKATNTGQIVGTPEYMSPEQVRGHAVDHRTDLYSLGIMLHELLTGRVPFHGDSPIATLYLQVNEPPALDDDALARLPAEVVALLRELLSKQPERRPASAAEVARRLREVVEALDADAPLQPAARGRPPTPNPTPPPPSPATDHAAFHEETLIHQTPPPKRPPTPPPPTPGSLLALAEEPAPPPSAGPAPPATPGSLLSLAEPIEAERATRSGSSAPGSLLSLADDSGGQQRQIAVAALEGRRLPWRAALLGLAAVVGAVLVWQTLGSGGGEEPAPLAAAGPPETEAAAPTPEAATPTATPKRDTARRPARGSGPPAKTKALPSQPPPAAFAGALEAAATPTPQAATPAPDARLTARVELLSMSPDQGSEIAVPGAQLGSPRIRLGISLSSDAQAFLSVFLMNGSSRCAMNTRFGVDEPSRFLAGSARELELSSFDALCDPPFETSEVEVTVQAVTTKGQGSGVPGGRARFAARYRFVR